MSIACLCTVGVYAVRLIVALLGWCGVGVLRVHVGISPRVACNSCVGLACSDVRVLVWH